jgi:hypothetical protein
MKINGDERLKLKNEKHCRWCRNPSGKEQFCSPDHRTEWYRKLNKNKEDNAWTRLQKQTPEGFIKEQLQQEIAEPNLHQIHSPLTKNNLSSNMETVDSIPGKGLQSESRREFREVFEQMKEGEIKRQKSSSMKESVRLRNLYFRSVVHCENECFIFIRTIEKQHFIYIEKGEKKK